MTDEPRPDDADQDLEDLSAFSGPKPPHLTDEGAPGLDDEALDTEELGEGGPAGA